MDAEQIVIAAGGGGIPVLQQGTRLKGASAVIEKDVTSACLAESLDADILLLLTGVEKVALNYGTSTETPLDAMSVEDATNTLMRINFLPVQCCLRSKQPFLLLLPAMVANRSLQALTLHWPVFKVKPVP